MLTVWILHLLTFSENQVVPVGLHNLSKSFRSNLTTSRVFSLGTKFIPIWKNMKIKKPFAKFEDFRRRMSKKFIFQKLHLERSLGIKIFTSKIIGGLTNSIMKLTIFVIKFVMALQI